MNERLEARRRVAVPAAAMALTALSASAFPGYDNPIMAAPALVRPGALLCKVDLNAVVALTLTIHGIWGIKWQ